MSKREYKLIVVDCETEAEVFEHRFNYEGGKIKFIPSSNKIAKIIKEHAAMESEFDPK